VPEEAAVKIPRDELIRMYDVMTTIMRCDERLRNLMMSGQVNMFYHSPRGQEVVAGAVGVQLTREDYLVTTYRGMHDVIAKGVPLPLIWGEWLGRSSGLARGRGGPMHLSDPAYGVMLATGIVGSGLPIATGLAFAARYRGESRVTVCSFGDGATNIGAFHEALNLASLWELPVLFLCQNNGYAESTPYAKGTAVDRVVDRAAGYRMTGIEVDGNDPVAMYEAAREAIGQIREGRGPVLLEARTRRLKGHYFGDPMKYIPAEELAAAVAADPVPRFRAWLLARGHATEDDLVKIEERASRDIEDAYLSARDAPEPPPDELLADVYAEVVAS
jgi:pyruvate dehydrogenase E1 component alpha subunit